ncbi:MAG: Na+/H+ antiporter NhaA [Pseudomonadota bacterium]
MARLVAQIQEFLRLESSSGILLIFAALAAMAASNSLLTGAYGALLSTPVAVQIGALEIAKPLLLWINDGLMAVFFFLVGLEIKREVLEGELSSLDKASLPIFAAIGGIAAPALIYYGFNASNPAGIDGWAIPAATDIAFALGFLALAAARAPVSLKIFLLAVAIIDDLGAIVIIALFYTANLSLTALVIAAIGAVGLFVLNRMGVKRITPYALIGLIVWVCVLKSGVHATLAGVVTALAIPITPREEGGQSPLHRAEHDLHPWVAFMILPLFAFANAGLSFSGMSPSALLAPIPLGIALGLFVGKPVGVLLMSFLAVRTGLARLPKDVGWMELAGVAWLTGVGFTMSLFIGGLAFDDAARLNEVRLGVLVGSAASAAAGCAVLAAALSRKAAPAPSSA